MKTKAAYNFSTMWVFADCPHCEQSFNIPIVGNNRIAGLCPHCDSRILVISNDGEFCVRVGTVNSKRAEMIANQIRIERYICAQFGVPPKYWTNPLGRRYPYPEDETDVNNEGN